LALRNIAYNPPKPGNKVVSSIQEAIQDIKSGSSIAIGGYGPLGQPQSLINQLAKTNQNAFTLYTATLGGANYGITPLLREKKVKSLITSQCGDDEISSELFKKG